MEQTTSDEQVKRILRWLAPTGIPLIAGAAGCAGRGILMTGCFVLSMLFAFFGAPPNWAKPFKESGDHWSETLFKDLNYGWERTVEFARSVKEFLGGDPVQENKQKYIDKSAPEIKGKEKEIEINKGTDKRTLDDIAIKTDNVALSQVTAEQVAYNSEREKSGDQQP